MNRLQNMSNVQRNFAGRLASGCMNGSFLLALLVALLAMPHQVYSAEAVEGTAQEAKYKKFVRKSKKTKLVPLVKFVTSGDSVRIRVFSVDSGVVAAELVSSIKGLYDAGSGFVLAEGGFSVMGAEIAFSSIAKITDSVYRDPNNVGDKVVKVIFWTSSTKLTANSRLSGSRVSSRVESQIPSGGFIRGSMISFAGDVTIDGEVNHSVIVFGGNITIGETGVIRDHVVALGGSVTFAKGSRVYGYIIPRVSGHRVRRPERPWTTEKQRLSFVPSFSYNRVDGFAPMFGWKFTDLDSVLPDLNLSYGLATTSERQRYSFSARQPLLRDGRLSINAAVYQQLKSDDDYLIPEWQNTLYALLATTDYKNYYEADGGALGVEYVHSPRLSINASFYTDRVNAIRSTRDLWSLVGGERRFYPNFQGIPSFLADSARSEFTDRRSAGIVVTVVAKNKRGFKTGKPKWDARAVFERSLSGLDSDFSFSRFSAEGVYELYPSKLSTLSARGQINASSGDLPLYRKFFLGGYHWLRGFDHKEFMGTKSWAVALDYGVSFKGVGLSFLKFWMFYDVGQVADHGSLSDSELLQSIGIGLAIEGGIRLNIARRLDESDPSLRIAVEF